MPKTNTFTSWWGAVATICLFFQRYGAGCSSVHDLAVRLYPILRIVSPAAAVAWSRQPFGRCRCLYAVIDVYILYTIMYSYVSRLPAGTKIMIFVIC